MLISIISTNARNSSFNYTDELWVLDFPNFAECECSESDSDSE